MSHEWHDPLPPAPPRPPPHMLRTFIRLRVMQLQVIKVPLPMAPRPASRTTSPQLYSFPLVRAPSQADERRLPRVGPARNGAASSETWSPGPRSFLGPLLLVPKAGGADGDEDVWLVTTVHTAGE